MDGDRRHNTTVFDSNRNERTSSKILFYIRRTVLVLFLKPARSLAVAAAAPMMYAKFDKIVADHEQAEAEAAPVETPEEMAQRERFLASLPPHMRTPDVVESLKTSDSFKSFQQIQKTKITRDDVEAWARGEEDNEKAVESEYSQIQSAITVAIERKQAGNNFFQEKKFNEATKEYTEGLMLLEAHRGSGRGGGGGGGGGERGRELIRNNKVEELWIAMLSNRSACRLFTKEYASAALDCTVILRKEPGHVKALWRRSQALVAEGDTTGAATDLRALLRIEPKNGSAKRALKAMIALEISKFDGSNARDEFTEQFRRDTKQLMKVIKKKDSSLISTLFPAYVTSTCAILEHEQWHTKIACFYSSGLDDSLLSLLPSVQEEKEEEERKKEVAAADITLIATPPSILSSVRNVFNLGFARLMRYTDETDDKDDAPHFFGSTMMSARAHVRALLRTAMTGNKMQLERLKAYMASTDCFRRPQLWVCNADRELMNRIRDKDTQGSLFHAFEGEMYRHVVRGTLHSHFFSVAEKRGGIEQILSANVQQRLRKFVALEKVEVE